MLFVGGEQNCPEYRHEQAASKEGSWEKQGLERQFALCGFLSACALGHITYERPMSLK